MEVMANNCVSEVKIPKRIGNALSVDYHPTSGLYAVLTKHKLYAWKPTTQRKRKLLAEYPIEYFEPSAFDILFVSENRIALTRSDEYFEGSLTIFTLKEEEGLFLKLKINCPRLNQVRNPAGLALTPDKNILVADWQGTGYVREVEMDWEVLGGVNSRTIWTVGDEPTEETEMPFICCTQDFQMYITQEYSVIGGKVKSPGRTAKQKKHEESNGLIENPVKIETYFLDGVEQFIEKVDGIAHDGDNLIIATNNNIILLESKSDGTYEAHIIASDITPSGQIRLKRGGLLMVCVANAIKFYQYKSKPESLQSFCRDAIRKTMQSKIKSKVYRLPIPLLVKRYLLFQ